MVRLNHFRAGRMAELLATVSLFVAVPALQGQAPAAQQSKPSAESVFSFDVYGDFGRAVRECRAIRFFQNEGNGPVRF